MAGLRLYLDEDITDSLAWVLRGKGFDVSSSHEVGMNGETDENQLKYATQEERAILTFNISDFAELADQWYQKKETHWDIIVSPQIDLKLLIRLTSNLLRRVTANMLINRFDWLQNYHDLISK